MILVYIIIKEGVYDQGVVGIHHDLDGAKKLAFAIAGCEEDGYHDFRIEKWEERGSLGTTVARLSSPSNGEGRHRRSVSRAWS